ncbi:MAG: 2-C-methyl-D-erythritol 4-phosphate cytidylyltransferase [Prevotella sp.]|nr:2-C-methyl-D-erythritol 4-phosphate cytidylyltransferase [Prevotella sp.]MBQ9178111.1 2-C-methyl-D-erythritol 4-phosphate cytidylyltransferase [Prevotella sp.]MBQ9670400.1 2-C-methyl-D-erythritol 4-phosphate cytidylyltransferase [Prevotella sp.]
MSDYVIIVAGGKGLRMGTDIPKQFLPLNGKPVLMRTIERFRYFSQALKIIVVLPKDQHEYWKQLCDEYNFDIDYSLADGGTERFYSVRNGLSLVEETAGIVAIHDGVRPFVSDEVIKRCFDTARAEGSAIPVIPVVETLRHVNGMTVPRADYRLVQTPQTFDAKIIRKAYQQAYQNSFTDDASVVEKAGFSVVTVEGNRENIKITTPFDMMMGETIVKCTTS